MTTTASGPAPQTITIDGCPLSYRRSGSGGPVLYLHGANGVPVWTPWLEHLAGTHDLIVPDHPGWGNTPMPGWLDNIHDLAYFYLDAMKALRLDHVHLVGHSIGGWLATEIAVRSSAALSTLTLIAPAGLRALGVHTFDIFISPPEANTRAAYYDQTIADRMLAEPPTEEQMDLILRNRFATARVGWQPRLFDPHLHKWLHRIEVPTLVLWGAEDRILPAALAKEFTSRIAGARETIIPSCGHVPQVEQPAALLGAIDAFLKEHP